MKSMPVRRTFLLRAALWHPFGDSSPRSLSSAGLSAPPLVLPAGLQDSGRETPATHAANPNHGAEHVRNTAAAASARGGFMGKVFAVRPRLPWSLLCHLTGSERAPSLQMQKGFRSGLGVRNLV